MCGRFHVDDSTVREVEKIIGKAKVQMQNMRLGDICPSQQAGVLAAGINGMMELQAMQWGFLKLRGKGLLINARSETVTERKMFRNSVLHRRCVIPARHYYEWDSSKDKVTFFREGSLAVYLAGFYDKFQDGNRFIILTTQANESAASVHERMPLVLEEGEVDDWVLDDGFTEIALRKVPPMMGHRQEYEQQRLF